MSLTDCFNNTQDSTKSTPTPYILTFQSASQHPQFWHQTKGIRNINSISQILPSKILTLLLPSLLGFTQACRVGNIRLYGLM